jgi:hypothetical protein
VALKEVLGQEKCIRQLALNVAMNAKFLSNQWKASQFIAGIVIQKEKSSNLLIASQF